MPLPSMYAASHPLRPDATISGSTEYVDENGRIASAPRTDVDSFGDLTPPRSAGASAPAAVAAVWPDQTAWAGLLPTVVGVPAEVSDTKGGKRGGLHRHILERPVCCSRSQVPVLREASSVSSADLLFEPPTPPPPKASVTMHPKGLARSARRYHKLPKFLAHQRPNPVRLFTGLNKRTNVSSESTRRPNRTPHPGHAKHTLARSLDGRRLRTGRRSLFPRPICSANRC